MKLSREDLFESDEYEIISDEITDHRRWCVVITVVVSQKSDGTFWRGSYETGATEYQDGYGNDDVLLAQVFPVEKTVTVYMSRTQLDAHEGKVIPND